MNDPGIGRLLISSLHQGISDVAPTRLEFYENWLSPTGMRDGRIGLAPLGAVLSFLHREEAPINSQIAECAGRCAADWTFAGVSSLGRWCLHRLPSMMRVRTALFLVRRLVRGTIRQSRVTARVSGAAGVIEIRSAALEQLREPASMPMLGYYAAAIQRLLTLCAVDAEVDAVPDGTARWRLTVSIRSARRLAAVDVA
jgi:hypothetical protein